MAQRKADELRRRHREALRLPLPDDKAKQALFPVFLSLSSIEDRPPTVSMALNELKQ
jgi:hypothetical protein